MNQNALGLIEVIGMTAAVEAADVCMKAANVKLIGYENAQKGMLTVKIEGDIGAVKAAIDAAKISASKLSQVVSILVIPRPSINLGPFIRSEDQVMEQSKKLEPEPIPNNESISDDEIHEELMELPPEHPTGSAEMRMDREEALSVEKTDTVERKEPGKCCNLCHDPCCPREKGQPHSLCIHHNAVTN